VTWIHATLSGRLLSRLLNQTLWIIFVAFRHFWLRTIQRRDMELASMPARADSAQGDTDFINNQPTNRTNKQTNKQTQYNSQMDGSRCKSVPICQGHSVWSSPGLTKNTWRLYISLITISSPITLIHVASYRFGWLRDIKQALMWTSQILTSLVDIPLW